MSPHDRCPGERFSAPARRAAYLLHILPRHLAGSLVLLLACLSFTAWGQTTNVVRIMAANLNGNLQSYQPFAIRIFQGLKPDVVAIQEFNYGDSSPAAIRSMVDAAFGTDFYYYREGFTNSGNIPNGIISRYPIVDSGSWADTVQSSPNRGFAWAQLQLPSSNALYVVSVHLLSGSSGQRSQEASNLKTLINDHFPANAWIVVAGDFNTDSRTETAVNTFKTFLSDSPIPTDAVSGGDPDTNEPRNKPYDYVLPSFALAVHQTNSSFPSRSYPNGLVFDSRVYPVLSDVAPVLASDSGNAQHMAVIKDFHVVGAGVTNPPTSTKPVITADPRSREVLAGTDVSFEVTATSLSALSYQWRFNDGTIGGATGSTYTRTNVQQADLGSYTVVVSNEGGSVTSAPAVLAFATAPSIENQPQGLVVATGQPATFTVTASGTAPLAYQWFFENSAIDAATNTSYTRFNAQAEFVGDYSVRITNLAGWVISSNASLELGTAQPVVLARWDFNSNTASTADPPPVIGTGKASLVGGTTATWAGGSPNDPASANYGWNTAAYPAQSTGNKTAGTQFQVSSAGYRDLRVSWEVRASDTASKYSRLQYSTNGIVFNDATSIVLSTATVYAAQSVSLAGIPGVENNPNFTIRFVTEFQDSATGAGAAAYVPATSGKTYGTAGTLRYDLVAISGTPIVVSSPAARATLARPLIGAGMISFQVSGTEGSNYVVQSAPALGVGWQSLKTNAAPFVFVQPNPPPHNFYRAVVAP